MPNSTAPILVASDMSSRSDRAMQRAFRLGAQMGRKVIAFSVLDDAMPMDILEETLERAQARLTRFADSLAGDHPHEAHAVIGDPTSDILAMIDKTGTDLLVLGAHRPRAFLGELRETTMQRIVRNTRCSVLLAQDTCDHDYDKIILACDFSPASTRALTLAHEIAPDAVFSPIHALHLPYSGILGRTAVAQADLDAPYRAEAEAADTEWRAGLPEKLAKLVPATEILPGSPYPVIRQEVESRGTDLIALGAHGRVGASRAILGSLASDLTRDPPCDLLITRP
ncbi:universal stress protein [Sedimentitalea arenosa]|uniref:Universal stress protein n=1 Tax=Sedimentitalea arenosa TaxID=2798803 RepID=A0A8J7J9I1_9RHOB|nr:universal stress protein [Arenibacterium arenosum]MBJ6373282.1 universal stress protein [Arenibacterium arenosum]